MPTATRKTPTAVAVIVAAVYVRISKDDGRGLGVARQLTDCKKLIERNGWVLGPVFTDNDVSAWSGKKRPGYNALLAAITSGEVQAVVAYNVDRLIRRPIELEGFFNTCDVARLTLMATLQGDKRLDNSDDRFYLRLMGNVAAKESDDKSRRLKRKMQERRDNGLPPGSRTFGWRTPMEQDLAEARIVKELVQRALAGESVTLLARWLDTKCKPLNSDKWTRASVRILLGNPRHAGLVSMRKEGSKNPLDRTIIGPGVFKGIISAEDHHRVIAILQSRSRRTLRVHPFTGILLCYRCKVPLTGGQGTYRCKNSGCGGVYVSGSIVEEFALGALRGAIDDGVFTNASAPNLQSLYTQIEKLDRQLVNLTADFRVHETIGQEEWAHSRELLVAKQEEAHRAIFTPKPRGRTSNPSPSTSFKR